jgi:uncharacterized membrane protein
MSGIKYVWLYLLSLVVFLGIDAVWLGVMSSRFYNPQLGDLMRDKPNLAVALVFYLVYVVGVLVLAVIPGVDAGSLGKAILFGALLGLVAYGTYDFTNLATVRGFPAIVAAVDVVWGTVLTGTVAAAGYMIAKWLG